MIRIEDKRDCCGCGACAQICPFACIVMAEDKEGFLYPLVDQEKCVQCGQCRRVCPLILRKDAGGDVEHKGYVGYNKNDDVREKSSSGGIFSILSGLILQKGGVVFGAAFDEAFQVCHMAIQREDAVYLLQGSKYAQSRIGDSYIETKRYLEMGKEVLFSGTPCQIAGLKRYLQKDHERLYTVEVLCHGVPSPKVLERYIRYQEKRFKGKVRKIDLRSKCHGWKTYEVTLRFTNDRTYTRVFTEDIFMQLFLKDICLRPSCHVCPFKGPDRQSDITIGDCWEIEHIAPEMDDDKGISVILINTKKGQGFFERAARSMEYVEGDIDQILPPTSGGRKVFPPHPKRERFFAGLDKGEDMDRLSLLIRPSIWTKISRKVIRAKRSKGR